MQKRGLCRWCLEEEACVQDNYWALPSKNKNRKEKREKKSYLPRPGEGCILPGM